MEKWGAPSTELQRVPEALIWCRTVRSPSGFELLEAHNALWNYDTPKEGRASPAGVTAIRRRGFVRASQISKEAKMACRYKGRTDSFLLVNWCLFVTTCRKVESCDRVSGEFK